LVEDSPLNAAARVAISFHSPQSNSMAGPSTPDCHIDLEAGAAPVVAKQAPKKKWNIPRISVAVIFLFTVSLWIGNFSPSNLADVRTLEYALPLWIMYTVSLLCMLLDFTRGSVGSKKFAVKNDEKSRSAFLNYGLWRSLGNFKKHEDCNMPPPAIDTSFRTRYAAEWRFISQPGIFLASGINNKYVWLRAIFFSSATGLIIVAADQYQGQDDKLGSFTWVNQAGKLRDLIQFLVVLLLSSYITTQLKLVADTVGFTLSLQGRIHDIALFAGSCCCVPSPFPCPTASDVINMDRVDMDMDVSIRFRIHRYLSLVHILTYQNVNSRYAFNTKDLTNAGLANDDEARTLIAARKNATNVVCGWIAELLCLTVNMTSTRQAQKQKHHACTSNYTECSRLTCALRSAIATLKDRPDQQTVISFAVLMCVLVDLNMILVTLAGAALPASLDTDGTAVRGIMRDCHDSNGCSNGAVMAQLLTIPMLATFCFTMLYEMLLHICEIARDPFNPAYSLDYINPDALLVKSEQASFHLLKPKRDGKCMLSVIIHEQEEERAQAQGGDTSACVHVHKEEEEEDCVEFDEFNMLIQKPVVEEQQQQQQQQQAPPPGRIDAKTRWQQVAKARRAEAVVALGRA
jgi:hypothetical protein